MTVGLWSSVQPAAAETVPGGFVNVYGLWNRSILLLLTIAAISMLAACLLHHSSLSGFSTFG